MMKDFHIHTYAAPGTDPRCQEFFEAGQEAGVDGGNIISYAPAHFHTNPEKKFSWQIRLEQLLDIVSQLPGYKPIFWFDPMEKDYAAQLDACSAAGIRVIKVICSHYYPKDVLPQLQAVADRGMNLMFHSGVIYAENCSSEYSRPLNFEALMALRGCKISLAHLSWPWCEECIALYGAFCWKRTVDPEAPELFFDLTPGTPLNRRSHYLKMLYSMPYDLIHNVLWGSDGAVGCQDARRSFAGGVIYRELDRKIFAEIAQEKEFPACNPDGEDMFALTTGANIERFMQK